MKLLITLFSFMIVAQLALGQQIDIPHPAAPGGNPIQKDSTKNAHRAKQMQTLNVIKISPVGLFIGAIPGSAELQVTGEFVSGLKQSSAVSISLVYKTPIPSIADNLFQTNGETLKISGYRFQFNHRMYIGQGYGSPAIVAPYGIYLAPYISYASAKISTKSALQYNQYIRATHFDLGILIGDQLEQVFWDLFNLDLFMGFGYKKNQWLEVYSTSNIATLDIDDLGELYNSNFKVKMGLLIGMPF